MGQQGFRFDIPPPTSYVPHIVHGPSGSLFLKKYRVPAGHQFPFLSSRETKGIGIIPSTQKEHPPTESMDKSCTDGLLFGPLGVGSALWSTQPQSKHKVMTGDHKTFGLDQIDRAHKKVKSGKDFPAFVQELGAIGLVRYDTHVDRGMTRYYGTNGFMVEGAPKYPSLPIAPQASPDRLMQAISIHQQGGTDYPTFCRQAAEAGVEKWTTHIGEMTVTYLDLQGNAMIVEAIPQA